MVVTPDTAHLGVNRPCSRMGDPRQTQALLEKVAGLSDQIELQMHVLLI